jgi:Helix-turn-helix domain
LSGPGRADLWAIRDNRTLSAHAKLAWFILLSRQPNCWPSLRTLAADMRVSKPTAIKAVRDLQKAGIVKIFADAPYIDTFIANSGGVCVACVQWEDDCRCEAG